MFNVVRFGAVGDESENQKFQKGWSSLEKYRAIKVSEDNVYIKNHA